MSEPQRHSSEQPRQRRLFLERRGYSQRRIADGARLLPVIGLVLWMIPLLWPRVSEQGTMNTSTAAVYVFAIWCVLIGLGAYLASRIGPMDEAVDYTPDLAGPPQSANAAASLRERE